MAERRSDEEELPPPAVPWALECKEAWCELILSGAKSIEVRRYPAPDAMMGHKCWLLASQGPEAQPAFGDRIAAGARGGCLAGWVLFDGAVEYQTAEQFAADEAAHCVPPGSPYSFAAAGGPLYGWRVAASHRLAQPLPLPAMERVVRSVYRVC